MDNQSGTGAAQEKAGREDWKHSKAVGLLAVVLVLASLAMIAWFLSPKKEKGIELTFICESTGEVFNVEMIPGEEATAAYNVSPGRAAPCRFDEKRDAYIAIKDPATGKWRKAAQADFPEDEEDGEIDDSGFGGARGGRGGEGGSRRNRPRTQSTDVQAEPAGRQ